jgi:uncharacterized protein
LKTLTIISSAREDELPDKVRFLSDQSSYESTHPVQVLETHMSWVFLTDQYVYKLKKPVKYDYLDFTSLSSRYRYCLEEIKINRELGGDTYISVVPLNRLAGHLRFYGDGETVEWLVKMKRLPADTMLDQCILAGKVNNANVQKSAEMLVDFYQKNLPVRKSFSLYVKDLVADIEVNSSALVRKEFIVSHTRIVNIATNLLFFIVKYSEVFRTRMNEGRIAECHGDLRPEHICIRAGNPVIIDRVEFDPALRIMDVAEELSFLALECELLGSPSTGKLYIEVYRWKGHDKIPDQLICFYKAKRALLRARLSLAHMLEPQYQEQAVKWRDRCERYLAASEQYCQRFEDGITVGT